MSQRNIDFGAFPDDPNADAIRSAFEKVQLNFTEVFAGLGDQAVISVNNTTGSGITVNQPTGNVVVSANISNMTFRSSTLDLGVGTPGAGQTALITTSSQAIWIDLPSTFATAAGDFGYILANTSSGNGNIDANNITLTNNVTGVGGAFTYVSGDGANLTAIAGGSVTGAVAFATTANAVAGANVSGEVTFAATANAVAGANVSGAVALATDATSANAVAGANVSGEVSFAQVANSVAGANVSGAVALATDATSANAVAGANVSGTVALATLATDATSANAVAGANVSGTVALATTAGTVTTAAQPNITSVGTLTVLGVNGIVTAQSFTANTGLFTGDGGGLSNIAPGNVNGKVANSIYADSAGSATLAGTVTTAAQPNITSVGTLSALSVTGNASAGNVLGTGGAFTYVSGDGANLTALPGANITGEVSFAGIANNVAGANVSGAVALATSATTANSVAGANVSGEVTFAATANAVAGANVSGEVSFAAVANSVALANVSGAGNIASLNIDGNVANYLDGSGVFGPVSVSAGAFIANGTSNATVDASGPFRVSVAGVANVLQVKNSGTNVEVTGSMSVSGGFDNNINFNSTANLGPESNVTITGGATNSFLKTDGAGGLSWDTGTLNPAQGADTQVIFNDGGTTYAGNTGFTFNKTTGVVAIAGNVTTGNVSGGLGSFTTVAGSLTTAAQPNITSVGTLTGLILSGNLNTSSDLITNAGNITISGGSGTFIGDGGGLTNIAGANVTGAVALATDATTANAVAGANVSGEVLNAATANAVAGANVSGAVSFATTANAVAGANVSGTVSSATTATSATIAGTANAVTGANVSGAVAFATTANAVAGANVSGEVSFAQVANSVAGANVSGEVLNAATANAVAGANVSGTVSSATTATTSGTVTTAAQPNITSVGTLTVLGVNGIITAQSFTANTGLFTGDGGGLSNIAGGNVGLVANATYATSAGSSALAGSVTTAAQPNITSVGTLTSLTVSGNITNQTHIIKDVTTTTAGGTDQGSATALTGADIFTVTTPSNNNGVRLMTAEAGLCIYIKNTSASNTLKVYPASTAAIDGISGPSAMSIGPNGQIQFVAHSATQWYTVGATYA